MSELTNTLDPEIIPIESLEKVQPKKGLQILVSDETGEYVLDAGDVMNPELAQTLENDPAKPASSALLKSEVERMNESIYRQKTEVDEAKDAALGEIAEGEQAVSQAVTEGVKEINTLAGSQQVGISNITPELKQYIDASGEGVINNNADGETTQAIEVSTGVTAIAIADNKFVAGNMKGRGRKILRSNVVDGVNVLPPMTEENTIYTIRQDYDLQGATITIPVGCVLRLEGGSLSNGSIVGSLTVIEAAPYHIFTNITLGGTFISKFNAEWFGAVGQVDIDNAPALNAAIEQIYNTNNGGVLVLNDRYMVRDTVYLRPKVSIEGVNRVAIYGNFSTAEMGSGIFADFSDDLDKWIIDSWTQENVSIKDLSIVTVKNNTRKAGVYYKNFSIRSKTSVYQDPTDGYVFGGMRVSNLYNSEINNIDIAYCLYGLAMSWSWINTVQNLWIHPGYCGIYLGNNATDTTLLNIFVLRLAVDNLTDLSRRGTLMYNTTLPAYCDPATVGVIMEGSSTDYSSAIIEGVAIQNTNALMFGTRAVATVNSVYLETLAGTDFDTLFWLHDGRYDIISKKQRDFETTNYYAFGVGSARSQIRSISFGESTCYEFEGYEGSKNYFIDVIDDYCLYYDEYTHSEEGGFLGVRKTEAKVFKNFGNRISLINSSSSQYSFYSASLILGWNIGVMNGGIDFTEFVNRYNKVTSPITLHSTINQGSIGGGDVALENMNLTFDRALSKTGYSQAKLRGTLLLKNTNVKFLTYLNASSAEEPMFGVSGNVNIIRESNEYNSSSYPKILRLMGDAPVDVTIRLTTETTSAYKSIAPLIENYDTFEYPYVVRVIGEVTGDEYIFTNTARPSKGIGVGYVYFDTALGKPIYWTGSKWVDAAGADV